MGRRTLAALATALLGAPLVGASPAEGPALSVPIACEMGRVCQVQSYFDRDAGPAAKDYRCGLRTYDGHGGVDFRVPDMAAQRRGVDVLAAADGRVSRLRDGAPDVSMREAGAPAVEGRECGNGVVIDHGGGWETQYCHLARGSLRVKQGQAVRAGEPIARVGLSGQTEFPHVHLRLSRQGVATDPFGGGPGCGAQAGRSYWTAAAAAKLPYRTGIVLNTGFAGRPVANPDVEAGGIPPPDARSPALVAYARVIGLEKGDQLALTLTGPDGRVLAQSRTPPMDRDKAQYVAYVGKRRTTPGWTPGDYRGRVQVLRNGRAVAERPFSVTVAR
jgi:murein DD-endopeptidase MepM/ murein hydrolase activator NlpD